jgi:hypothetical protein
MDSTYSIPWFAGLFEGEGCFIYAKGRPRNLSINMTDEDVIRRVHDLFGGTVVEIKAQKEHHKMQWRWTIFGEPARQLAKEIEPFLLSRRQEKCRDFIEKLVTREQFLKEQREKTQTLRNKVRELVCSGMSHRKVAAELGISHGYVGDIMCGKVI